MPLYTPIARNLDRLQVDPDADGDWLRIGDAPWHRVTEEILPNGSKRYALQVRISGAPFLVAFADWPA